MNGPVNGRMKGKQFLELLARLPARAPLPSARAELSRFRGVIDALDQGAPQDRREALAAVCRNQGLGFSEQQVTQGGLARPRSGLRQSAPLT